MSKQTNFSKEEVMKSYLGGLLSEEDEQAIKTSQAKALLEKSQLLDLPNTHVDEPGENVNSDTADQISSQDLDLPAQQSGNLHSEPAASAVADLLDESFQALFFEVAGLTLAVPLITLGGIHKIDKIGPLFGKPSWFMGVMLHRESKFNVVDSAKWVMPEKVNKTLEETLHYEYLIMLADSEWGLASDKLVNTVTLNKSDVKWRANDKKRPWLAGMVKERMCALIDVYQLISMLNKGLGSDAQD